MPSLKALCLGLPGIKEKVSSEIVDGLIETIVADVTGSVRWPFLKEVGTLLTWTSATTIQSFPNLSFIENLETTNDNSDYFPMIEFSDKEFRRWQSMNPEETRDRIWRPAGYDGNKLNLEIFAAPAVGTVLRCDAFILPSTNDENTLPARFTSLIVEGVKAHVGTGTFFDYERQLQRAVAREQNISTSKRRRVGMDAITASRMRNINNPA